MSTAPDGRVIRSQDDYEDWMQEAGAYCQKQNLPLVVMDEPRAFPFRVRSVRTQTSLAIVFFTQAQARELVATSGTGMVQNYHALRIARQTALARPPRPAVS